MLKAGGADGLRATSTELHAVRRRLHADTIPDTAPEILPLWRRELADTARTALTRAVFLPAPRVDRTDDGIELAAATSTRPLRGGLVPARHWRPVELGASERPVTVRQRSRRGRPYTRRMVTGRQFRPRTTEGRVAAAAAKALTPRIAEQWEAAILADYATCPGTEIS